MKKSNVLFLALALTMGLATTAYAETGSGEKSVTGFFRRLFNYPVKATQKTGEMTKHAVENTGEKVLSPAGENIKDIATGQPQEADLGAPIGGAVENVGQAVSETVQIPVQAAEETPAAAV